MLPFMPSLPLTRLLLALCGRPRFHTMCTSVAAYPWLRYLMLVALTTQLSCQHTKTEPLNAEASYERAKESYEDGSYEEAIEHLKAFRSRFPYSRYGVEADLLIAHAHFELGEYPNASMAYQQFIILHPDHPAIDFASFRAGLCYWKEASTAANREQEFTRKALVIWERLEADYPESSYLFESRMMVQEGTQRIMDSKLFVIRFYCRQKKWLSCLYATEAFLQEYAGKKELSQEITHKAHTLGRQAITELLALLAEKQHAFPFDKHLLSRGRSAQEFQRYLQTLQGTWQSNGS